MRVPLPHGNYCTPFVVIPSNWKTCRKIHGQWFIYYRFISGKKVKQVGLKGMNSFMDLKVRRDVTQKIINAEWDLLINQGYNPFTKKCYPPIKSEYPIDPETPFCKAIEKCADRLKIEEKTRKDIKSVLARFAQGVALVGFTHVPIKMVRRRHIKLSLEQCNLSAFSYNRYRAYLGMIFKELVELEVIETNYIRDISKQKTVSKMRLTLTDTERKLIDEHLKKYPAFRRFTHIFFHSGARESELMRLKVKDVDLTNQVYKCVVRKGKQHREVMRTIKTIALPFWKELVQFANPDHYVFSVGLVPGERQIRPDQITKRWYKHVKPLGIEASFYSLKHSNTSEVVDILSDEDAAKLNAHKNTSMVVKIYDTKRKDRQHERLKGIGNKF